MDYTMTEKTEAAVAVPETNVRDSMLEIESFLTETEGMLANIAGLINGGEHKRLGNEKKDVCGMKGHAELLKQYALSCAGLAHEIMEGLMGR